MEITRGVLKTYEYRAEESQRWVRTEFCPLCGTLVTWTAEAAPGGRGIAGGTFDDPNWLKLEKHGLTRSAQHWVVFPADVELYETSGRE